MVDIIVLTRLNLVHVVDRNTPIVVIEEMAKIHNIPYVKNESNTNAFTAELCSKPIGFVHDPIQDDEWTMVAKYVNPECSWSRPELRVAYNFLRRWEDRNHLLAPQDFTFGLQTPNDPKRLNACVLYAICKANGIRTCRSHTLYQLATMCRMLVKDIHYSRSVLYQAIGNIREEDLIKVYRYISLYPTEIREPDIIFDDSCDYNEIVKSFTALNNKKQLRLMITPRSYAEAIVLGALNYSTDLSRAKNPIREYTLLSRDESEYKPEDEELRALLQVNPECLCLEEYFNPLLPPELYSVENLKSLARVEGYTNSDIFEESAYELLQTAYLSYTFYHGKQQGIKNTRTPFLYEDLDELENGVTVCFGVQGGLGTMTAFRYIELAELFKEKRNFINPLEEDEVFPSIAIDKLKNLCQAIRASDSEEVITERQKTYEAIIATELFTEASQARARELFLIHEQATSDIRLSIEDAITKLFKVSMYMRGWLGEGEYPIVRAPVDNQALVDLKVTEGLREFEEVCTELENVGDLIMNLPLLGYRAGTFHQVSSDAYGKTIGERLEIVKAGDDHDNYDSCIRLTSNYLAATSYRYMEVLGMERPFSVDNLRTIS